MLDFAATLLRRSAVVLPLWLTAGIAVAQSGLETNAPGQANTNPADGAVTSSIVHRSVLDSLAPVLEPDRIAWRDANEAVATIGGWREYAREGNHPHNPDTIAEYMTPVDSDQHAAAFAALEADLATESLQRRLDGRRAWIEAVAARQHLIYVGRLHDNAAVSAELARRMEAVGNSGRRARAREQLLHADTALVLVAARHAALASAERLARLLHLDQSGLNALSLPKRLPELPDVPLTFDALVARLPGATDSDRSRLRESWSAYRASHDTALLHRERILPLRAAIAEERLYEYSGMLIGVFDLLVDSRKANHAVLRAIDASRRFRLAEIDLQRRLEGLPVARPTSNADIGAIERLDAHDAEH